MASLQVPRHTPRDTRTVTDDEVLELAAAEGFRLVDKIAEHTGTECIGWRRGDDDRWPLLPRAPPSHRLDA